MVVKRWWCLGYSQKLNLFALYHLIIECTFDVSENCYKLYYGTAILFRPVVLNRWVAGGTLFWVAKTCIIVVLLWYMGRQILFHSVLWVAKELMLRTTGLDEIQWERWNLWLNRISSDDDYNLSLMKHSRKVHSSEKKLVWHFLNVASNLCWSNFFVFYVKNVWKTIVCACVCVCVYVFSMYKICYFSYS